MGMVSAGVPGFGPLGDLYYKYVMPQPSVKFSGMTVQQLFDLANEVLGGNTSNQPAGTSVSDLSDAITISMKISLTVSRTTAISSKKTATRTSLLS